MGRMSTNQKILDVACENSEVITDILKKLDALIPPENKADAEILWKELQHRMFYQDYLYDCHRPFTPGYEVELDYEAFDDLMKKTGQW